MSFLNPIAWWGLLGILVPLGVFLLSKRKSRVIDFSSLQFMEISEAPSARSIRPTEWLKFILRTLFIISICFMMAGPQIMKKGNGIQYYVEKDIFLSDEFSTIRSEIPDQSVHVFTIDSNLDHEVDNFSSAWDLIYHINEIKDSVVVFTHSLQRYFKGSPEALKTSASWKVVPFKDEYERLDTVTIGERVMVYEITGNEDQLDWKEEVLEGVEVVPDVYAINILFARHYKEKGKLLQDLLSGMGRTLPFEIVFQAESARLNIVLDTIVPNNGLNLISGDTTGQLYLEEIGTKLFEINGKLNEGNIRDSDFVFELASLLIDDFFGLEKNNRKILSADNLPRKQTIDYIGKEERKDLAGIWIPAILILGLERWFSLKK